MKPLTTATIHLTLCSIFFSGAAATEKFPFDSLPTEVVHHIVDGLSTSDATAVGRVSQRLRQVSEQVLAERTDIGVEKCLHANWNKMLDAYKKTPWINFSTTSMQSRSWQQCYTDHGLTLAQCHKAAFDLDDKTGSRLYMEIINFSDYHRNMCSVVLNRAFSWLAKLHYCKQHDTAFRQVKLLAYMVEYLKDRQLAATLHATRMRLFSKPECRSKIPHSMIVGDHLLMMDAYVRYLDLAKAIKFEQMSALSTAMLTHFVWRNEANARRHEAQQPAHHLYLPAIADDASVQEFFDYLAMQAQFLISKVPQVKFTARESPRWDLVDKLTMVFLQNGSLRPLTVSFNTLIIPVPLTNNHHVFHQMSFYGTLEQALRFYRIVYKQVKSLSSIVYAGTSPHGTQLLNEVFADVLGQPGSPIQATLHAFQKLQINEGLIVMAIASAMLHTPGNWHHFSDLFSAYLTGYPHRKDVHKGLKRFVDMFVWRAKQTKLKSAPVALLHRTAESQLAVQRLSQFLADQ